MASFDLLNRFSILFIHSFIHSLIRTKQQRKK